MVDYKLDKLCRKAEKIPMYYKSPIYEIFLGPPRYPKRKLKKVERIFAPVIKKMEKDLNNTSCRVKIKRIKNEMIKATQMKADYQRRIVLWYELGKATYDSERRFIFGNSEENQLKYNELHKLEGIYSDFNKGLGFPYLEKIRIKLRLYPTEEQISARRAGKPEPRISLQEHLTQAIKAATHEDKTPSPDGQTKTAFSPSWQKTTRNTLEKAGRL